MTSILGTNFVVINPPRDRAKKIDKTHETDDFKNIRHK